MDVDSNSQGKPKGGKRAKKEDKEDDEKEIPKAFNDKQIKKMVDNDELIDFGVQSLREM